MIRFLPSGAVLALALASACKSAQLLLPSPKPPDGVELHFKHTDGRSADRGLLLKIVLAEFGLRDNEVIDRSAIDDAAFAIELDFVGRGHAFAKVDYTVSETPDGDLRGDFLIDEGPLTSVEELVLEATGDPDRTAVVAGFLAKLQKGQPFVETHVSSACSAATEHLIDAGHLRAHVTGTFEITEDRTGARVRIAVDAGPLHEVRAVTFEGAPTGVDAALDRVAAQFVDKPYTQRLGYEARAAAMSELQREGHAEADVKLDVQIDPDGRVEFLLRLAAGPRIVIREVRVEGNRDSRTSWIRSLFGYPVGHVYDSERVRAGFRRLYSSGVFDSVRVDLVRPDDAAPDTPERVLLLTMVERKSLELFIEPGWGSYEGPRIQLGLDERNLFGTGLRLHSSTSLSEFAQKAELSVADVSFLRSPWVAEASVYVEQREEPAFDLRSLGTALHFRRDWRSGIRTTFGYRFRRNQVEEATAANGDDVDIGELVATVAHDDRENPFDATRGTHLRATVSWASSAFGSEADFVHTDLEGQRFLPFVLGAVAAVSLRTGIIVPVGGTEQIPLPERLFNGGENSVRSFKEDELGPLDAEGDPIGGEAFTTLSIELRRKITGNLSGALFADFGNLAPDYTDYLEFNGVRSAVGVGVRYLLPIGPLRLDLGVNPNPRTGEDDVVLHFALGYPF